MKLPITDKFLWDLYESFQAVDDMYTAISPPKSFRHYQYQDINRARKRYERMKARKGFSQFINYLIKRGYIRVKTLKGVKGVMLTSKGLEKVFGLRYKIIDKKKRTDGRWIMIIFDIPEEIKKTREFLRKSLVDLGYRQLQKSVWVCPYDVHAETEAMIRSCETSSYVRIFLINEVT